MVILSGIICLIFLCGSILILSLLPISLHEKSAFFIGKKSEREDAFSYLFDVYGKSHF
ncbi:hypothetical protein ACFQ4X_18280 [Fictibacillus halophilus]|uniref:hypothetical protein n=1 Tax=Fictibacillus halophilus TaxID=1610490 RepID=UPI003630F3E8